MKFPKVVSRNLIFLALGVAGAVVSTGCPNDLCSKGSCANGQYATGCKIGFVTHVYCTSTPSQGEGFCATDGGAYAGTELCGGATSATSGPYYPDWDPDAAITLVSGVYEVDSDMVDQIRDDFNTVTLMDSSRLNFLSTGYAELTNVSSSDMVHHLGFQNNDIIISISDGITGTIYLNGWADYIDAAITYESTTEFTVTVNRGSSTITLDYEII